MQVEELLNREVEKEIKEFSLLDFIDFYVDNSLEIAENELSLYDFDSELIERISMEFDIDKKSVSYLSNPFYWYFRSEKSPIKFVENINQDFVDKYKKIISNEWDISRQAYVLSELNKKSTFVSIKENFDISAGEIKDFIYNRYEKYFNSRLKKLEINSE